MIPEKKIQEEKVDSCQYQLTYQNTPEISLHADPWNRKKYEGKPDQQTDYIGEKDPSGHSKSLQNAGERGIQI